MFSGAGGVIIIGIIAAVVIVALLLGDRLARTAARRPRWHRYRVGVFVERDPAPPPTSKSDDGGGRSRSSPERSKD